MKGLVLFLTGAFLISQINLAVAAPNPGASLEKVAPKLGVYRSPNGFELAAADSGWKLMESPSNSKYVQTVFRDPNSKSAILSVRVDDLPKSITLEKYVQKWQKEYPKFGFEMLGAKSFSQNGHKGFVLDIFNRQTNKQLRQAVYLEEKTAVILTCRDLKAKFNDTLKSCNKIIKTFSWNKANSVTK